MTPTRLPRRVGLALALGLLALATSAQGALAHSAFLGSNPEPGQRLGAAPRQIVVSFTESLNGRLSTATLISARDGKAVPARLVLRGRKLTIVPPQRLTRGAFRVRWHTVSSDDGHALEGYFSFGLGAPALGGEHSVQQSPFARDGWLRVVSRTMMYLALLMLAGALILDWALRPRGGGSWLVPASLPDRSNAAVVRAASRERLIVTQLGLVAAGAAALTALADAVDAAGGWSPSRLSAYMLSSGAGLARTAVVFLALLTGLLAVRRRRAAVVPALLALGAVALSGHANSARPRALALVNDWFHLASVGVWLGGIALIVLVWGPTLRRSESSLRLTLARHVLPRFGAVALPAFVVVVATGLVSALIQLGSIQALWETDYGQILVLKMALVAGMAAGSYWHAIRLRPRLIAANPHPPAAAERRHWRLLRTEPLLGVGAVIAVAVLVAFPLPPRQFSDSNEARAASSPTAACNPCPQPRPKHGELAVADYAGSQLIAGWIRRTPQGLLGRVRALGTANFVRASDLRIVGAQQSPCGPDCQTFRVRDAPHLTITLRERGRVYTTRLPTRWDSQGGVRARWLLARAQAVMRRLSSVRETESITSGPGSYAHTVYRLKSPDRLAYRTGQHVRSIVIGKTSWNQGDSISPWQESAYGGGLPFRTRSWFNWSNYAQTVYLLNIQNRGPAPRAVIALMDPGTPAWWRLEIDLRTFRVRRTRLMALGHFMRQTYYAPNQPLKITPPPPSRVR